MKKIILFFIVILIAISVTAVFSLSGCKTTAAGETTAGAETTVGETTAVVAAEEKYIPFILHHDIDPFAMVIQNGIRAAEKDFASYNIRTQFIGPPSADLQEQIILIDAAIAKKPWGMAVTCKDVDALGPKIKEVISLGIPVVLFNNGAEYYKELGAIGFVGANGYSEGAAVADRWVKLGRKNVLFINNEQGNTQIEQRLIAVRDVIEANGGKVTVAVTEFKDPAFSEASIKAAFQKDKTIDCITGGWGGGADAVFVVKLVEELGLQDQVKIGLFDPGLDILTDIKNGKVEFITTQQQFLQGYMPIQMLILYKTFGVVPKNAIIYTGGGFIDASNVDTAADFINNGIW